MSMEVKLPELGEGIDSGDVLGILVREGNRVEKGQGIVELETDKATVEVPSSHAGVVAKIHVAAGQSVPVGGLLISLEADPSHPAQPAPPPAATDVLAASAPSQSPRMPAGAAEPASSPLRTPLERQGPSRPRRVPRVEGKYGTRQAAGPAPRPNRPPRSGGPRRTAPCRAGSARLARELGVDLAKVAGAGKGRQDHPRGYPRGGGAGRSGRPGSGRGSSRQPARRDSPDRPMGTGALRADDEDPQDDR